MREVKFRAWNEYAKQMRPVPLLHLYNENPSISPSLEGNFMSLVYHPKTVLMQYTGLKDKNGVEIYEGDIIKLEERVLSDNCETSTPHIETKRDDHFVYADKTVGLRVWGHEVICIDDKFGTHNDDWTDYFGYESPSAIQRGEVIGNIYENSELLEDTQ